MNEEILKQLRRIVGSENVLSSREDLYAYSLDASRLHKGIPALVVRPHSSEQVAEVVTLANRSKTPLIPRGGGTNLVGAVVPVHEATIVLDLTGMNKIVAINRTDLTCRVEAGVVHSELEKELSKHGLFWPPDPGSSESCTLGGVLAMNAGGMRALKYGTARDWVLGLKVVVPTGKTIKTGSATLKSNVGYDLTRLMVGSEGTLGVITEASLKVCPLPETILRISAYFESVEAAVLAVGKIFESGLTPLIVELMDRNLIRAVNEWLHSGLPDEEAYLLIDIDGTKEGVDSAAEKLEPVLISSGARHLHRATSKEEMDQLYLIRRESATAIPRITGKTFITHDLCVPLSRLPEAVTRIKELGEKWNIPVAILSHAGDGNIHPMLSVDFTDSEQMKRANRFKEELGWMALDLGGTISGEHGIGIDKADMMVKECGEETLRIMKSIKKVLDPNNIMNPGKMGV